MKKLFFAVLLSSRALNVVSWLNRKKVTILCYHNVISDSGVDRHDPFKQHLPVHLFLKHLDHLTNNYCVVSLTEFLKSKRENRRLPHYSVVLIFDDGHQEFNSVAAAQLTKRKLPATVFLITDRTSGKLPTNDEDFLSWREVQDLAAAGITIGSHTCSHPCLLDLPLEEVRRELADAKTAILSHLQQDEVPLSYPYGQTSEAISQLAKSLGYCCGITGVLGPNGADANVFSLRRTVISSDDDLATFAARVSGLTWWANTLRQVLVNVKRTEGERAVTYGVRPSSNYEYQD